MLNLRYMAYIRSSIIIKIKKNERWNKIRFDSGRIKHQRS